MDEGWNRDERRQASPSWVDALRRELSERHVEVLRRLDVIENRLCTQNGRLGKIELEQAEWRGRYKGAVSTRALVLGVVGVALSTAGLVRLFLALGTK